MKRAIIVLLAVLMAVSLFVSCGNDPFFHEVKIKYEDKIVRTDLVYDASEYTLPKEVEGIPEISGWTYGEKEYAVGDKITVTSDITITAVVGTPVVITLYDEVTKTVYVRKGQTELTLPEAPERAGYDFDGWDVDGTTYASGAKVKYTEGMKITGVWKKIYTVTYLSNGGSGTVEADTFKEGEGVTIKDGTGLTHETLSFSGWNTQADGKGKAYSVGEKYNENKDLTLYAVWSSEITITYKVSGVDDKVEKKDVSETVTLCNEPTWATAPTGFVFDGWYTQDKGEGKYFAGGSTVTESLELYAHWIDEDVEVDEDNNKAIKVNSAKTKTDITSITIPSVYHGVAITSIRDDGFNGCTNLTSVSFEKASNITSIGYMAFLQCSALKAIDLSETNVTEIYNSAFSQCKSLAEVILPTGLKTLTTGLFHTCTALESISLPSTLTSISNMAFCKSGLKSITVPKSVESIGESAFEDCTALESVVINGVKELKQYTLRRCTALKSVTLPDTIESIDGSVFNGCSGLTIYMGIAKSDAPATLATDSTWGATNSTVVWSYKVGDTVQRGTYPPTYGGDTTLCGSVINWKVLHVDSANSRILVISEKILDLKQFDDGSAESYEDADVLTSLDTIYNNYSLNSCADILDVDADGNVGSGSSYKYKLFLLSESEVDTYFGTNSKIAYYDADCSWWLRTFNGSEASYVNISGEIASKDISYELGIRPAMWLSLSN